MRKTTSRFLVSRPYAIVRDEFLAAPARVIDCCCIK